jgi:autotransporter-associated beta strand protein
MSSRRGFLPAAVLGLTFVAAPPAAAQQQNFTWTGAGAGIPPYYSPVNWSNPYNWLANSGPASGPNSVVTFGAAPVTSYQDVANPFLLNQVVFSSGAGAYTVSGAPIQLQFYSYHIGATYYNFTGGIVQNSINPMVIGNNITLGTDIDVFGSGTGAITLAGNISNGNSFSNRLLLGSNNPLDSNAPRVVTLSGGNNTYTDGTDINVGTLRLGNGNAIPTGSTVQVFAGATFDIGTLSNNSNTAIGTLYLAGTGQFIVGTGSNGDYHLSGLDFSGGAVTDGGLSNTFYLHLHGGTGIRTHGSNIVATIDLASASRVQNDSNGPTNINVDAGSTVTGIDLDISAIVSGAGTNPNFVKTGDGQLRLTNLSNTANFTISRGSLRVDDMANLGSGAITLNGGTLQYNGGSQTSAKSLSLSAASTINVVDPLATLTLSAAFSGAYGLTKSGPGTLVIGNVASSVGPAVVNGGILQMGAAAVGDVNLLSGAYVVAVAGQSIVNLSGAAGTTLDSGGGFSIGGNNSTTFAGSIIGAGGVTKGAAGPLTNTLTLTGVSTFSGPLTVGGSSPGGTVALGTANALLNTVPVQLMNSALSLVVNNVSYNQAIGSLASNAGSTVNIGSAVLTVGNDNTNQTFSGSISGSGAVAKVGTGTWTLTGSSSFAGGTTIGDGNVVVYSDFALGSATGPVAVGPFSTLTYSVNSTTARTFTMNNGTLAVAAGQTLTLVGGRVGGGFLRGPGSFVLLSNSVLSGVTTLSSAVLTQAGSVTYFNVTNGGALTIASPQIAATSGFTNAGSGSITLNQDSFFGAADFQTYGVLTINPGSFNGTTGKVTQLSNTGSSPLHFDGGSRTFISNIAQVANQNAGIDVGGNDAIVAGGLFVNNGFVFDSVGAGTHRVVADYGALVKGAGFYQPLPRTINGGTFIAGNSPGRASTGTIVLGGLNDPDGGLSDFTWQINNAGPSRAYPSATGVSGPSANAAKQVSGWGTLLAVAGISPVATNGNFRWDATPTDKLTIHLQTLLAPDDESGNSSATGGYGSAGDMTPGLMADFDPTHSYSWRLFAYAGGYAGPTDTATLDASTNLDTSGFINPHAGRFDLVLNQSAREMDLVFTPTAVPEPGTLALTALGFGALRILHRRRR